MIPNFCMSISPLVSVLVPTYNAGNYLRPAVQSILDQTYQKIEVLIIDDGSTDGSLETLRHLSDDRLSIIHQQNGGKSVALNKGLEMIKGDFWLIQDADDLSYPDRVEELLAELLRHNKLAATYSGHDLIVGSRRFAPTFTPHASKGCKKEIANYRMVAHDATGMYRSSLVGPLRFNPELRIGQGIDFSLQVGERHPISKIGRCLYSYRINYNSTIRKNSANNAMWVSLVKHKAAVRRNTPITDEPVKASRERSKARNTRLTHIVSHCMSSVLDHKEAELQFQAFKIGLICASIAPYRLEFFKPLLYALTPLRVIQVYRWMKYINRR